MSKKLYSILAGIASEMGAKELIFKVEVPKEKSHGDLSSNLALALAQKIKKSPLDLAEEIVERLDQDKDLKEDFEKIEAVAPGFINFYYSKKYLSLQVLRIIKERNSYGSVDIGKGKKASVEYVSANPTGPLHIGNARGGPLGDIIANVLSKAGYKVTREYLHNDVGGQVEKLGETIYYTLNPEEKPQDLELQYKGSYIKDLSKQVQDQSKNDLNPKKAGELAVEIMLKGILSVSEKMGIKFDKVTKESELQKDVPEALKKIEGNLKKQEGALWFAPNDEFLKDRETVVRKSNGELTYFASDIVYHERKLSSNDLVIDVLGSNHSGHVPKLLAIVAALGYDVSNFRPILYQYVRLKGESGVLKMSKREGNIVEAKEVLDEVGRDAFRFFLAMQNPNSHIDFDVELAKKKASENPVFYVQYAHTRIASIFAKTESKDLSDESVSELREKEEIELIRVLLQLPSLVENISQNFAINLLTNYATEVATAMHRFYEKHQVLNVERELKEARLALLKATQITLKNTLDLLGVSAPEKM
jgi:arginyl-tRNA synthetase